MPVIAVIGGQWGDEGKGKVVDQLAERAQVVVRAQGGDNAGHTVVNALGQFALHLVPAGIFNPATLNVIGAGVAVNPRRLLEEMDELRGRGVAVENLLVSERAHLVLPYHPRLDQVQEQARGDARIGTTGRGIGPAYADKAARVGLRVGDMIDSGRLTSGARAGLSRVNRLLREHYGDDGLPELPLLPELEEQAKRLRPYLGDPVPRLAQAITRGETVLIEGAHGAMLDLDYGTYPFVTSSFTTVAGLLQGAGIGPRNLSHGLGVFKAYQTRVGEGPMPTELDDPIGEQIRQTGREFGTTTGRPRRCGWFDAVAGRHVVIVNSLDSIVLTRLDVLDGLEQVKICVGYELDGQRIDHFPARSELLEQCLPVYEEWAGWQRPTGEVRAAEDLPLAARRYVHRIGELLGVPVSMIGVGAHRDQTILVDSYLSLRP
jgi:adenylosuccinate synthase